MWNGVGRASLFSKAMVTVQDEESKSFRIGTGKTGTTAKKKLNYNAREISAQILRARKSKSAADVLSRAKGKVSALKRCLSSGQYDTNEVRVAIAHASRMVECAGKKLRNLREEEGGKARSEKAFRTESAKLKGEARQKAAEKERELRLSLAQKELQLEQKIKEQHQQMARKKRMHRSQEYAEISDADMAYLKQKLRGLGGTEQRDCGTATLELSYSAMQLNELAQQEQMLKQMELQAAQELAQIEAGAIGMEGGMETVMPGVEAASATPVSSAVPAASVSVDVSV